MDISKIANSLNLEKIIIAYYIILSFAAIIAIFVKPIRSFTEYGKQTVDRNLNIFFINKKAFFGHYYISAVIFLLFIFYQFGITLHKYQKSRFLNLISVNSNIFNSNEEFLNSFSGKYRHFLYL
jgi:hypothetical protein